MTQVHYFQRYSQRENVHTNNTLLLLARIQKRDPSLLRDVLGALVELEEAGLEVGVQISQQTRAPDGVPDGMLYQSSFRVVIEAKGGDWFDPGQLTRHLQAFGDEQTKILLLLAPVRCSRSVAGAEEKNVHVVGCTFRDIVKACDSAGLRNDLELREILDDYEKYCHESGLISNDEDRMMVVTVGATFAENIETGLYYCPTERGYQKHHYLGLYTNKMVRAIGMIDVVVNAELKGKKLVVQDPGVTLQPDHEKRICSAIESARKRGWDQVATGHRFFLVHQFVDTEFQKTSRGGLLSKRYFSLRDELGLPQGTSLPDPDQIASKLSKRTWE